MASERGGQIGLRIEGHPLFVDGIADLERSQPCAWANVDLFEKLGSVDREKHRTELKTALRLLSHYYMVSRIFGCDAMRNALQMTGNWLISMSRGSFPATAGYVVS